LPKGQLIVRNAAWISFVFSPYQGKSGFDAFFTKKTGSTDKFPDSFVPQHSRRKND
jgi:hypothetical protein